MSYANFKPLVWSSHIQHDLPKFTILENDCDYQFQGEAEKGKKVKILGVARPTIGDYTGADIGTPEAVPDTACYLDIDQAKYFNFMVDDIDKAQSTPNLMSALMEESTRAMAEKRDTFIAELVKKAKYLSASTAITSKETAKAAVDAALKQLFNNGVKTGRDKVTIYLNPNVYMYLWDYIVATKTANDTALSNGNPGTYMGATVKMGNNFYNDGIDDYLFIKTSKAIAFCGGINSVEPYRPEGLFSDAIKGLNTYGGKIVRPKELYVIKAH